MEKLIKKFESIIDKEFERDCEVLEFSIPANEIFQESKKIAIEFANFCNSSGDCTELFDKFIEEHY